MGHFVLTYTLAPDYLERRPLWRDAHLTLAKAAVARGELLLGGALSDPADRALLLFQGNTADAAEAFACADPYVANGLVTDWSVRAWTTVVGPGAAFPM